MGMNWGNVELQVSSETLRDQAREVERRIDAMKLRFDEMDGILRRTRGYWIGAAAEIYRTTYEKDREEVRASLQRLRRFPGELMEIAGIYVKTEESVTGEASMLRTDVLH